MNYYYHYGNLDDEDDEEDYAVPPCDDRQPRPPFPIYDYSVLLPEPEVVLKLRPYVFQKTPFVQSPKSVSSVTEEMGVGLFVLPTPITFIRGD